MEKGHNKTNNNFIGECINANQNFPTYLSHHQTNDAIETLSRATSNKTG